MSEFYLVRHGQASFGAENYDQLSELGAVQSRHLGAYFAERNIHFDYVLAGTMRRHRQTLDGIKQGMASIAGKGKRSSIAELLPHPGFNEYDFVAMTAAYQRQYPEDMMLIEHLTNPQDKRLFYRLLRRILSVWSQRLLSDAPESWDGFNARVKAAGAYVQSLAEPGNRILAVSSGGAISTFIGHILMLQPDAIFDLNMQAFNTGVSRCFFNSQKFTLASFNHISHLDHLERAEAISYG